MNCKNRINGKKINEALLLDTLYTVFMLCYVIVQYIVKGKIEDILFVVLLSFGTYFVNWR